MGRSGDDPLMPVRLRAGGRSVGGAMSWGEPKALEAFPEDGPFAGLAVPDEVRVSAQVMAEPDPELAGRTLARLADGTPLVTRRELGSGQVVLFHVTANAEWSGLPLSGLFVRMLERLAVSAPAGDEAAGELEGTVWTPEVTLDAYGVPRDAGELPGVPGEVVMEGASAAAPPGLYSDDDRFLALNVIGPETELEPMVWPAGVPVEGPVASRETPLGGWLLAGAVALLAADVIASLLLMGRLRGAGAGGAVALLAMALMVPGISKASTGAAAAATIPAWGWLVIMALSAALAAGLIVAAGCLGARRMMRSRAGRTPILIGIVPAFAVALVSYAAWSASFGDAIGGRLLTWIGQWCLVDSLSGWFGAPGLRESGAMLAVGASDALLLAMVALLALALRRAGPILLALGLSLPAQAQDAAPVDDAAAVAASETVTLAHVLTGDGQVDDLAQAGLYGLSRTLFQRTSVEPAEPVGVDPETDELSVYPLLYWPITPGQAVPSDEAYAKLNRYLRSGGMILFDTRDAYLPGSSTPEAQTLQRIAEPLDVPPLEVVPEDHVLTRSFYLLQDFPGRHNSPQVWVETAPPDAELAEGMPFRNLNDGVTPVVIGGNDWAAAWAEDDQGRPMVPIGRGFAGERQREIALRFGVNLVMHVLTGNYKSDQVHVPALLDRLGQ